MTEPGRGKHDPALLMMLSWHEMSRGQRIAATRLGIVPPIRSERERQLRSRYNMLLEDYEELLDAQGGVCAACGETYSGLLYVDHDHETGRVRGLLCPSCNTTAGFFDNNDRLLAVWKYVYEARRNTQIVPPASEPVPCEIGYAVGRQPCESIATHTVPYCLDGRKMHLWVCWEHTKGYDGVKPIGGEDTDA